MKDKLPAFQFYPGDWKKDPAVQSLSFHDRGVWFEIILLMHESAERGKLLLNGLPMPEDALARLLGLDKQILTTTITTLLTYGVASRCEETGALLCRRMVRDEHIRQVRKAAGSLGGNPDLVKQKRTTKDNQKSTPSSSTSSSTSSSDKKKIGLHEVTIEMNAEWLNQKRAEGRYLHHDEYFVLEQFKQYCESKGKKYENHLAGYRNAFEWEKCQPKSTTGSQSKSDRAKAAILRGLVAY